MEVAVTTRLLELRVMQSSSQIITYKPTPSLFYRPDALPVAQPTVPKHKGKISHSMDLLTPSSTGVLQLCLWPLIAPGYLGEGFHASQQPSDASIPVYFIIY